MTAPSPLVEKVARAIHDYGYSSDFSTLPDFSQEELRCQAQAALTACHAEELVDALRTLIDAYHSEKNGTDTHLNERIVARATALLHRLDGKPMEQPA